MARPWVRWLSRIGIAVVAVVARSSPAQFEKPHQERQDSAGEPIRTEDPEPEISRIIASAVRHQLAHRCRFVECRGFHKGFGHVAFRQL